MSLALRAGQDAPDDNFYRENSSKSKKLKKEFLWGYNIYQAQYDEVEVFAIKWMHDNRASELDFSKQENHYVRGKLFDALEDQFPFLRNRRITRVWRDSALHSLVRSVRSEFKNRPELMDLQSPRKRRHIDDYRDDTPTRLKGPVKAKAT